MADTLLFRGGSSASIDVASIQSRELAIDTDTDQIVSGPSRKKTVMEDSDGRVGIGTTSPDGPLHISASNPVIKLQDSDGTDQYSIIKNAAGNSVYDAVNGAGVGGAHIFRSPEGSSNEHLRIDSSGDVLIGGTLPSAPHIKLKADGSADFYDDVKIGNLTGIGSTYKLAVFDSGGKLQARFQDNSATDGITYFGNINGETVIRSRNNIFNGNIVFRGFNGTTDIDYGLFDSDGNLKIGGTLPASPNIELNADGSAAFRNNVVCATASGTLGTNPFVSVGTYDSTKAYTGVYNSNGTKSTNNPSIFVYDRLSTDYKMRVWQDGSATFAGTITSSNITAFKSRMATAVASAGDLAALKQAILDAVADL